VAGAGPLTAVEEFPEAVAVMDLFHVAHDRLGVECGCDEVTVLHGGRTAVHDFPDHPIGATSESRTLEDAFLRVAGLSDATVVNQLRVDADQEEVRR
jgi:hypothetical protein